MDRQQRLGEIVSMLKQQGCRMTPQRMAIIHVLVDSRNHPSIEDIYAQVRRDFPMTSLATVYKTVALLGELGQVTELSTPNGVSRYDGATADAHPHITCLRCGRITDINLDHAKALFDTVTIVSRYRVVEGRMDFWGLCPACQLEETTPSA